LDDSCTKPELFPMVTINFKTNTCLRNSRRLGWGRTQSERNLVGLLNFGGGKWFCFLKPFGGKMAQEVLKRTVFTKGERGENDMRKNEEWGTRTFGRQSIHI